MVTIYFLVLSFTEFRVSKARNINEIKSLIY